MRSKISTSGRITILLGKHQAAILIWVDRQQRELVIQAGRKPVKQIPRKGLQNRSMNFPDDVELMCKQAASTWHRLLRRTPTYMPVTL